MPDTDVAARTTVAVGLDYDTDSPWVWVGDADKLARDCEDCSTWFLAEVPTAVAERFRLALDEINAAVGAVHEAAGYDRQNNRLAQPCASFVGEPLHTSRGVFYDDCDRCGWTMEEHPDAD